MSKVKIVTFVASFSCFSNYSKLFNLYKLDSLSRAQYNVLNRSIINKLSISSSYNLQVNYIVSEYNLLNKNKA